MTRRVEAEAMLTRYGGSVTSGGETFRAFLRPMSFTNGEGRNTPDDYADSVRFFYVGPAAHKLAVGGTVTADGENYAVKRCETVRLAGEELFVRAVLAPLSPEAETEVRLERDGKTIAHAESYAAQALSDADVLVPWGESGPEEVAQGAACWTLTLSGVREEPGADLFTPGAFRVVVARTGGKTIYSGCRWKSIRHTGGPTREAACTMEALAADRSEETEAKTDG